MAPAGNLACPRRADDQWQVSFSGNGLNSWRVEQLENEPRSPPVRANLAAILYSVGPVGDPDHEAAMRFGSVAPRRWAHSNDRSFRPRSGSGHHHPDRRQRPAAPARPGLKPCCCQSSSLRRQASTGRGRTPSGTSPAVTILHKLISSLRARATIILVLLTLTPSVRAREPFCKRTVFLEQEEPP